MPSYKTYGEVAASYDAGRSRIFSFRKTPTQTTATGIWFDLSMSGGNPVPNYYAAAPLAFKAMALSTDGGMYHGSNVSPSTKHLHKLTIQAFAVTTATPLPCMLLDYLGYYPFCDMTQAVALDNTSALTRYTDGEGVQMMVVEVASQIGGTQFYCTYTNQDGVAGRVTPTHICNTQIVNGTIIHSGPNLAAGFPRGQFMTLQAGDTGVRSVQEINFTTDDVGLVTIVLVKPLATVAIDAIASAIYSPAQRDYALDATGTLPVIEDDAYLNLICLPTGTISGATLFGTIETIWSE